MGPRQATRRALLTMGVWTILLTGCDSSAQVSHGLAAATSPSALGGGAAQSPSSTPTRSLGPGGGGTAQPPSPAPVRHLRLVAIGDSLAQGKASGCPSCTDYVDLYGQALSAATGVPVDVQNLAAVELSALPAVQATQLLNDILTDADLRQALAGADAVVISVGFNDTPWNRFDNPCDAANADVTVVAWDEITPSCIKRVAGEFKQTLDEILTQVDELRGCFTPVGQPADFCRRSGRKDTLLRIVTVYNDWIGWDGTPTSALAPTEATDRAFVDAQCWEITVHGGRCADAYHALNGSKGTTDAAPFLVDDHTHLDQAGHRQIADALTALGFDPLP